MTTSRSTPETDAWLATVLESIGDPYYALDRDWRIVLFNGAAEAFFKLKRKDVIGRHYEEFYPPGPRGEPLLAAVGAAMNTGERTSLTFPSEFQRGMIIEVNVAPLGDQGVGVIIRDVTERATAEKSLRESQQRLDLAVGANRIGIFDWHVPSGRSMWNGEMEDIFGIPRGSFEGHTNFFRSRVVPEDLARIDAETAEAQAARRDLASYEFRIVRADGAIRWLEGAARFIYGRDGQPRRVVGTNVDVTDRKVVESQQRLLMNELNHRVKNTLAIVQGIAWQSFRAGGVSPEVRDAFEGRLAALSAAHDVLTRQSWESGSITHIVAEALAPHHAGDGRLTAAGPSVDLEPKAAVALGLAMHELATNAVKYGALSMPSGRVEIRWTADGGLLKLSWRESGGPPVRLPIQRGFGARLLEQGLAAELGGSVTMDFRPEGLVCAVEAPLGD